MPISFRISRWNPLTARPPARALAPRSLFLAGVLAAIASLQACFNSGETESPYTVPAGESLQNIQLETEADGTILVLAQASMYFSHEDPQDDFDRIPRSRNLQTYAYRRSKGVWTATPFKNLQRNPNAFPVLIPEPSGRFQALIWDYTGINRFVFREGGWTGRKPMSPPAGVEQNGGFGIRNWTRHPNIGAENDSSLLFIHSEFWEGTSVTETLNGRRTFLDTLLFFPTAYHVGRTFQGTVGHEYSADGRDVEARFVYYYWKSGDATARKTLLGDRMFNEGFFSPFEGNPALYITAEAGIRIMPLGVDGKPGTDFVLRSLPARKDIDSVWIMEPLFAPDSAGCIHVLDYFAAKSLLPAGFVHRNTCREGSMDTLPVPQPVSGRNYNIHSTKMRVGPSGSPLAAFILQEVDTGRLNVYANDYGRTWLYLAELRDGKWVLEVVTER